MREFFRTLKDDGWAILAVPVVTERTIEDPSIGDARQREEVFGQGDHVRKCGRDYVDRIREAGFNVDVVTVSDMFQEEEALRMGLTAASGDLYYCTKRHAD